jgi:hypothetical protein
VNWGGLQIAYATGFDSIQESANEALAEIMLKFMAEIGACAHAHCEVAGRTTPNILDVVRHTCWMLMIVTIIMIIIIITRIIFKRFQSKH